MTENYCFQQYPYRWRHILCILFVSCVLTTSLIFIFSLLVPYYIVLETDSNHTVAKRNTEGAIGYDDVEYLTGADRRDILRDTRTSYVSIHAPPNFGDPNRKDYRKPILSSLFSDTIYSYDKPLPEILTVEEFGVEPDNNFHQSNVVVENESVKTIREQYNHTDTQSEEIVRENIWKGKMQPEEVRKIQAKTMKRYINTNINPCEDFYQFSCGNWAKYNQIPADKTAYDTFEMLRESLDAVLRDLLTENQSVKTRADLEAVEEGPQRGAEYSAEEHEGMRVMPQTTPFGGTTAGDAITKAKNLYKSCVNTGILKERGDGPLLKLLEELGGWPMIDPNWNESEFDLILLLARLRLFNNDILISEWIGPDIVNSNEYIIQIDQTSLGLPSREYFLEEDNLKYIEAYRVYMTTVVNLLGVPILQANKDVDDVITFETLLAEITAPPDFRKEVSSIYQRLNIGDLKELVPQFDWYRYFKIILGKPIQPDEPVACYCYEYLQNLVVLLSNTPARIVANYLLWRFVRHRVNNLDDKFDEAKQRFYYVLFGREKTPPRWQVCVSQVNSNLGMALGAMFVSNYFDEMSKNDTLQMTMDLQQSFRELLIGSDWLDKDTKEMARIKMDAMRLRIGYPDFILNPKELNERYADIQIHPDYYFENMLSILQHLTRVESDRLGTEVNKTLWNAAPAVVNAYYSRNKNQIMFPAGILQPPFYHRYFPKALNYGGIGIVIGHEITHGFDDKGRLFDKEGNLQRWWRDSAIDMFHEKAQCLIEQYNSYIVPEVNIPVDGVNTQGENIADNGGVKQAFRAYQHWLQKNPNADETLPGLNVTGKQLFFLNFAQVWCGSSRPEAMRNKLKTAVHSPGRFRVIGTLSNSKDFAEVYNCPPGSPMNPLEKCSVW